MFNIAAGTPCPQFSLPDEDGAIVTLDTLKGRPFVLYVYPKDDTPGCTTEALDFTALLPAVSYTHLTLPTTPYV